MKIKYLWAAIALATIATGCGSTKKVSGDTGERLVEATTPTVTTNNAITVLNGEWTILDVEGYQVVPEDEDRPVTITFKLNDKGAGELYSYTGVNYVNGDVEFDAAKGTVTPRGNYMSTMMAGSDAAMATESRIVAAVTNMATFKIEHLDAAFFLYLKNSEGKTLLTARRWDNHFLNGAWEVTAIGNGAAPSRPADIQIVIDIPAEKLHGNAGCNIVNGNIRLTDNRINGIEFSDIATTRKLCPEAVMTLEREFLVALENVASCQATPDGEGALLKDEEGNTVITLHRLVLKR